MRVCIDTTATRLGRAGTVVYVRELIAAMRHVSSGHEITEIAGPTGEGARLVKKAVTAYRDVIWQNVVMPRLLRNQGADLLHSPVLRTTLRASVPLAVTALDFYSVRNPAAFSRWSAVYARHLGRVLRNARVIISISEFTRNELLSLYPHIPTEKIFVTPLGVASKFHVAGPGEKDRVLEKYSLKQPFMLCVNTLEPRKNLPAFIAAFTRASEQIDEDLVMIGGAGWISRHQNDVLNSMKQNKRIHYLGYVPDEDLAPLYSAASCYVFPSHYEGFGLPVLEAMACGCPVLTSHGSSLSEVAGDAALYMDPASIEDMVRGICECSAMSCEQREAMTARGLARAREYSWERCARLTLEAYEYAVKA